jgi:hypothetical protein
MSTIYKRQYDVTSFTQPSKTSYKVSERFDGTWECSCPAWKFHTPRQACKHITKVQNAMRYILTASVFVAAVPTQGASVTRFVPKELGEVSYEGYRIKRRVLDDEAVVANVPKRTARAL